MKRGWREARQAAGGSGRDRSASPTFEQETVEGISKELGGTKKVCVPGMVLVSQISLWTKDCFSRALGSKDD